MPIFAWNFPLISLIFLKRSLVFPILLFLSISLHWSLRKPFLSLLGVLWKSAFRCLYLSFSPLLFTSQLFVRPTQTAILLFLHFFFLGMVLLPVFCTVSQTSIHRSSGTLSIRSSPFNLFALPLYNCKGFDLVLPEWPSGFPYFLQFKSEFDNKAFMIWATVSSQSCFCWLYRASPSLAAKRIINLISVLTLWWFPCVESSLVLLEEGVCHDQCVLLAKLY